MSEVEAPSALAPGASKHASDVDSSPSDSDNPKVPHYNAKKKRCVARSERDRIRKVSKAAKKKLHDETHDADYVSPTAKQPESNYKVWQQSFDPPPEEQGAAPPHEFSLSYFGDCKYPPSLDIFSQDGIELTFRKKELPFPQAKAPFYHPSELDEVGRKKQSDYSLNYFRNMADLFNQPSWNLNRSARREAILAQTGYRQLVEDARRRKQEQELEEATCKSMMTAVEEDAEVDNSDVEVEAFLDGKRGYDLREKSCIPVEDRVFRRGRVIVNGKRVREKHYNEERKRLAEMERTHDPVEQFEEEIEPPVGPFVPKDLEEDEVSRASSRRSIPQWMTMLNQTASVSTPSLPELDPLPRKPKKKYPRPKPGKKFRAMWVDDAEVEQTLNEAARKTTNEPEPEDTRTKAMRLQESFRHIEKRLLDRMFSGMAPPPKPKERPQCRKPVEKPSNLPITAKMNSIKFLPENVRCTLLNEPRQEPEAEPIPTPPPETVYEPVPNLEPMNVKMKRLLMDMTALEYLRMMKEARKEGMNVRDIKNRALQVAKEKLKGMTVEQRRIHLREIKPLIEKHRNDLATVSV